MKTNKEKAQEVLRRVNTQNSTLNEGAAAKPVYSKKAKISFIAMAMAAIVSLSLVLGLVLGLQDLWNKGLDLDKMYIANFDSYAALGAGAMSTSQEGVVSAASGDNFSTRLIGVDDDGKIERARYKEHKEDNGKGKEITYYLTSFCALKNYTLVEFSDYMVPNISDEEFCINETENSKSYLIDNATGRFYSLNIDGYFYCSINLNYSNELAENETSIYLRYTGGSNGKAVLFQVYVQDDTLIFKERVRWNPVMGADYFVDIYGNVFVEGSYESGKTYIIDKQGKMKEGGGSRNLSGRVYVSDTDYYGEDGEIVNGTEQTSRQYFFKDEILKKEGNVWYCFNKAIVGRYKNNSVYTSGPKTLFKVTWKDEYNYSVEGITILDQTATYAITKDYIYFYKYQNIYKVDIKTGEKLDLKTDKTYFFSSISTDNLGNVLFEAYDEYQNKVTGVINNEGEITVDVEERKIEVYYIQPLR